MTVLESIAAYAHGPFETFEDLIEFYNPRNSILQTTELPFTMAELAELSINMKHREEPHVQGN